MNNYYTSILVKINEMIVIGYCILHIVYKYFIIVFDEFQSVILQICK